MSVQEARAVSTIRWSRVVIAGFLAEVALIVVAVPFFFLPNSTAALNLAIPPASFLVMIAFGYWAARGSSRGHVLNGMLTGLAGVVLYVCLTVVASAITHRDLSSSVRPAYLLAHALKLAGGAVGGMLAARRRPV